MQQQKSKPCMLIRRADGELVMGQRNNAELTESYFSTLLNVARSVSPDLSDICSFEDSGEVADSPPSFNEVQSMVQ